MGDLRIQVVDITGRPVQLYSFQDMGQARRFLNLLRLGLRNGQTAQLLS